MNYHENVLLESPDLVILSVESRYPPVEPENRYIGEDSIIRLETEIQRFTGAHLVVYFDDIYVFAEWMIKERPVTVHNCLYTHIEEREQYKATQ